MKVTMKILRIFKNFNDLVQEFNIDDGYKYNEVLAIYQNDSNRIFFGQTGTVYKSGPNYFFNPDGEETIFEVNKDDFFVDNTKYPI